jgi:hypothetical protein
LPDNLAKIADRAVTTEKLVLIDGIARSGKSLVANITCSFDRVEMWQTYPLVEEVPVLNRLGHISDQAAIAMLRREIDMNLYYTLIGRRVNFRYGDQSGIWKSRDPKEYFRRIFADEEGEVLYGLKHKKPILPIFTHDVMCNSRILFEAFPKAYFLWPWRHPVDVAYSWYRNGRIIKTGVDAREIQIGFAGVKEPIPWFMVDCLGDYEDRNFLDQNILASLSVWEKMLQAYDKLSAKQRAQTLPVIYESAVSETDLWIEKISGFLDTTVSAATSDILYREKLPNVLTKADFDAKLALIHQAASDDIVEMLMIAGQDYEKLVHEKFGYDVPGYYK